MAEKKIDVARVRHIATLASLSLGDDEAAALAKELEAIVAYVEQLDSLDTTDVEPTAYVQLGEAAWREDALVPGLSHEDALDEAPQASEGGFAVPAFVE